MRRSLLVASLIALVFAAPAAAQTDKPAATNTLPLLMELRVGSLWPQAPTFFDLDDTDPSSMRVSVGGRLNFYFGQGRLDRRVSLQIAVDWADLGSAEFIDDVLGSGARTEGHFFVITPALGFDVLRTRRTTVEVRAGPAIVADLTTYLLERHDPSFEESDFENVCDLVAFKDRCTERTRFGGAAGFGIRWVPNPQWPLFLGFDYTRLTIGRNVAVVTVGRDWR